MRKKMIYGVLIIFLFSILFVSSASYKDKIDKKIYERLEENNEVRVIVKLKVEEEKGFFIKTKKTENEIEEEKKEIKKKIEEYLGEEDIRHIFDKSIAVSVSEKDLTYLNKNLNIEEIIIDKLVSIFLQDSVSQINASSIWPIQLSGINITGTDESVCVIDTGVNFTHPDLIGKNKTCVVNCITENCIENCSVSDDNGHGTHVAGIVGAIRGIGGVGPNVGLIGVKVLNESGSGYSGDVYAGIDWCVNNASLYNISVITMSLGDCSNHATYCNADLSASHINAAVAANISVVIAAGNGPGVNCPTINNTGGPAAPACVENATAVGAVNVNDAISYQRGGIFELFAPGVSVNSTYAGVTPCLSGCSCSGNYMICSGTSMAAPHVAGVFALFRQFFRLQNNRIPTPSEIKLEFNNTGILLDDSSGSGSAFSRIDLHSALVSIDNSNPFVNLSFPLNDTVQFNRNISFNCSANDVLLSNITLYIWNSTDIYNSTETVSVSGVNAYVNFNITLNYGDYNWNCLAYDSNNNFSFSSSNYSLSIGYVDVSLNSPFDNYYTNQNQSFNCSAETEPVKELANASFYFWNSTRDLFFNSSANISGIVNSTIFDFNFSEEGNYIWNCLVYNNNSEFSFADSNYTVIYDITKPNISLINPLNSQTYTSSSQTINFQYNVSDVSIDNCSLIVNNQISLTNSSLDLSIIQNFSQTFTPGDYNWHINCTDSAGNTDNSSQRIFTITAPVVTTSSGGGGGGGGGSDLSKTYSPTIQQTSKGYTEKLNKNDKIKFTFFDEKSVQHTLTVTHIGENFVNISIQSNVTNIVLGVRQSRKLNLSSPDYYDLYIRLNSIANNKAELVIQTIHETISKPSEITGEIIKNEEIEEEKNKEIEEQPFNIITIITNSIITVILIIAVLLIIFKKRKPKQEGEINKKQVIKKTIDKINKNKKKNIKKE